MKQCLRRKCQKEFEPNKPKQVFCSAKCRVYFSREEKPTEVKEWFSKNKEQIKAIVKKPLSGDEGNKKQMPEGLDKFQKLRWLRENS